MVSFFLYMHIYLHKNFKVGLFPILPTALMKYIQIKPKIPKREDVQFNPQSNSFIYIRRHLSCHLSLLILEIASGL